VASWDAVPGTGEIMLHPYGNLAARRVYDRPAGPDNNEWCTKSADTNLDS
jgi:hypothetical protein